MSMREKSGRNLSLDMVKGLMILWVPAVHLIRLDMASPITVNAFEMLFSAIMLSFFILSGYMYRPGKRPWAESVKRRTVQLLKPFVIWSLVVLAADALWMVLSGNLNRAADILQPWLRSILSNQGIDVLPEDNSPVYFLIHGQMVAYWFIGTMMVSSLLFFELAPLVNKSVSWTLAVSGVMLLLSGVLRGMAGDSSLPFRLEEVPAWSAAMLLGCLAGKRKMFEKCPLSRPKFLLSCVPVLAALWFLYPISGGGEDLGSTLFWQPLLKTAMSFMQLYVMVFAFQLLRAENPAGRFFAWLGKHTMTLLLCHMLFGSLLSLATGLYCLTTVSILYPDMDRFSAPSGAIGQGLALYALTVALSLLLCLGKDRISLINNRKHTREAH